MQALSAKLTETLNQLNNEITALELATARPLPVEKDGQNCELQNEERCRIHFLINQAKIKLNKTNIDKSKILELMCLNQSDVNRRQIISEGLNKIQSFREKSNCPSQIEIDFLMRKIQFASEFKLYDE